MQSSMPWSRRRTMLPTLVRKVLGLELKEELRDTYDRIDEKLEDMAIRVKARSDDDRERLNGH